MCKKEKNRYFFFQAVSFRKQVFCNGKGVILMISSYVLWNIFICVYEVCMYLYVHQICYSLTAPAIVSSLIKIILIRSQLFLGQYQREQYHLTLYTTQHTALMGPEDTRRRIESQESIQDRNQLALHLNSERGRSLGQKPATVRQSVSSILLH